MYDETEGRVASNNQGHPFIPIIGRRSALLDTNSSAKSNKSIMAN